jgi:hypothetical protein
MSIKTDKSIFVTKKSGETEPFSASKLKASLKQAGADDQVINRIAKDISGWVHDGVTTGQLYARAYKLFRKLRGNKATRYKLKKALLNMGPTGYPFEHLIGELFRRQGYEVEVGQVVEGVSITHEMDVIATKDGHQHLMECKYSRDQGSRISVQVPLYVHSRVNDVVEKRQPQKRYQNVSFTPWVVTNARFSSDSLKYSRCKGIHLLGWDVPKGDALKELMERERIFPITILRHLTKPEKQRLMADGVVTCLQLSEQPERLHHLGLSKRKQQSAANEIQELLGEP